MSEASTCWKQRYRCLLTFWLSDFLSFCLSVFAFVFFGFLFVAPPFSWRAFVSVSLSFLFFCVCVCLVFLVVLFYFILFYFFVFFATFVSAFGRAIVNFSRSAPFRSLTEISPRLISFRTKMGCIANGFTGFNWILLKFTEFHRVLLSFTGFYRVLLGFT